MNVLHSTTGNSSPTRIQFEPKETRVYPLYPQHLAQSSFLDENTKTGNGNASQFSSNETPTKSKMTSDEHFSQLQNQRNTEGSDQMNKNPKAMLTTATVYMGKILLEINFIENRLKTINETIENHLREPRINSIRSEIFEFEESMQRILQKTELELQLKFDTIHRQVTQQLSQIYFVLSEWISMMSSKSINELTIHIPSHGQINIEPQQQVDNITSESSRVLRRNKRPEKCL